MHKLADHQLIKLIQESQNEQACEELIRRYYGILRQLVKYKVPAYADIDDIVQEILIKMITKIDQLRIQINSKHGYRELFTAKFTTTIELSIRNTAVPLFKKKTNCLMLT